MSDKSKYFYTSISDRGSVDDQKLVRVLKALGDKSRFRMVQEIARAGELSCGQVGERFDLTQPTVSHHLKILADAEVLLVRREGQHAFISVNGQLLDEAASSLPPRVRPKPGSPTARKRSKRPDGPAQGRSWSEEAAEAPSTKRDASSSETRSTRH